MYQRSIEQVCPKQLPFVNTIDINKLFLNVQSDKTQQIPTHDITCVIANLIFWHVYRYQKINTTTITTFTSTSSKKRTRQERDAAPSTSVPRTIAITSDYDTSTNVTARVLGEMILDALSNDSIAFKSLADIRLSSGNSGNIHHVTMSHFRKSGEQGYILCPSCGKFLRGEQGLWWHQKMVHGIDHTNAKDIAKAQVSSAALVPYNKNQLENVRGSNSSSNSSNSSNNSSNNSSSNSSSTTSSINTNTSSINTNTTTITNVNETIEHTKNPLPSLKKIKTLSPGMEAAKNGDLITLRRLVEQEKWNAKSSVDHIHGSTALLWAAGGGHLDICQYLIETCGSDPNSRQIGRRSFGGRTALHWAARRGHLNICRYLIEHEAVPIDSMTDDGTTSFCWCCWQGHLELAKYFILQGCDSNTINKHGCK